MLKKISLRKIIISTVALFALLLIYLVPTSQDRELKDLRQDLSYVDKSQIISSIFLLDQNNHLALTNVAVTSDQVDVEKRALELMEILIQGGSGEDKIPSGFRSILPSDTKVLNTKFESGVLKINFSKELLDIPKELEEKMVEAIVYTLTSIDGVSNVIIYIDNVILSKLPQSNITLPSTLNRNFGINKQYDFSNTHDITWVTVYYLNKYNGDTYYVPVTKYVNDDRDKIEIIVESLKSSPIYNTNLMSYLNSNTELLETTLENNILDLHFNTYIFSDADTKNILEEVIYTICLSIQDNYDVDQVVIHVDNEEIYKTVLKSLENE